MVEIKGLFDVHALVNRFRARRLEFPIFECVFRYAVSTDSRRGQACKTARQELGAVSNAKIHSMRQWSARYLEMGEPPSQGLTQNQSDVGTG